MEKPNKVMADHFRTINKLDLIGIYRISHPTIEGTFVLSIHGKFGKIDHILGFKTHLNKF